MEEKGNFDEYVLKRNVKDKLRQLAKLHILLVNFASDSSSGEIDGNI